MEKKRKPTAAEEAGIKIGDRFETGKRSIKTFQVDKISAGGRIVYDERNGKGWCAATKRVAILADGAKWRKVEDPRRGAGATRPSRENSWKEAAAGQLAPEHADPGSGSGAGRRAAGPGAGRGHRMSQSPIEDHVLAPLDWMRVRIVGKPEDLHQARWVGREGVVVLVDKRLPHWARVRLDRQVKLRLFNTEFLRVLGESPTRALMLANGYTASADPVSPTAPPMEGGTP